MGLGHIEHAASPLMLFNILFDRGIFLSMRLAFCPLVCRGPIFLAEGSMLCVHPHSPITPYIYTMDDVRELRRSISQWRSAYQRAMDEIDDCNRNLWRTKAARDDYAARNIQVERELHELRENVINLRAEIHRNREWRHEIQLERDESRRRVKELEEQLQKLHTAARSWAPQVSPVIFITCSTLSSR